MAFEALINDKKAIFLRLDNVIYPQKDYLLQVYYLFSEFLAYMEQMDSTKVIAFMQAEYLENGEVNLFEKTAERFQIPEKYQSNFQLLHQNARLPLKLLPFSKVLAFMQEVVVERKELILLVDGDPVMQLNKIRQLEWHGLEQHLKVYFTAEFGGKGTTESVSYIKETHALSPIDILLIGSTVADEEFSEKNDIKFLYVTKL